MQENKGGFMNWWMDVVLLVLFALNVVFLWLDPSRWWNGVAAGFVGAVLLFSIAGG